MDHRNRPHNNLIELTRDLIRIPSPYYQESQVIDFVLEWLRDQGLDPIHHHYKEEMLTGFEGENVICVIEGEEGGPTICLNGHLDTVNITENWSYDPLAGEVVDGKLYGVGALDMKSGCAAIMIAFRNFIRNNKKFKGKLILTLVSDEEGPWGLGTNALIEDGLLDGVDCAVVTEPSAGFTDRNFPVLCLGAKGSVAYEVTFKGKAAHAAMPENGISAAVDAAEFLVRTAKQKNKHKDILGEGKFCPLLIESDGGACSVPENARVLVQRHIVTGETIESVLNETEELLKKIKPACDYQITVRPAPSEGSSYYKPYVVPESDSYAVKIQEAVTELYGGKASVDYMASIGDFNYLATRLNDVSTLLIGPDGDNFHQADEHVYIDTIEKTEKIVERFLEKTLLVDFPDQI